MATGLNSEVFGAINIGASLSIVGEVLLWALVVILILAIGYFVYYITSFKNTLIIRDAVHNRKIIKKTRWKESSDSNKNIWLVTPFNRIKKPLPPSKAIELTAKGRKWVEAWRGEDTETLLWVEDSFDYSTYKEVNKDTFQPLSTQERELLVNEVAKSKAYQKRNLYDTIVQISMIMAPIILIAVIGLTLGDITEALGKYANPLTSTLKSVGASFENAASSLSCVQNIEAVVPSEVPN